LSALHLPEGSFGGEIKKLYEIVWDYNSKLKELLSQYFSGIVDLKGEFFEMAKNSIILLSEVLDVEKLLAVESTLRTSNPFQVEFEFYSYRSSGSILLPERPVPFTEVLNEISPFLFAGLINIDGVWESGIRFKLLR